MLMINQDWSHSLLDPLMHLVSAKLAFAFPVALLIGAYLFVRFQKPGLYVFLASLLLIGVVDLSGFFLKWLFAQARPCLEMAELLRPGGAGTLAVCTSSSDGMPSNHAFTWFAFAMFYFHVCYFDRRWSLLFVLAILVGWSRIYLGVHYPSQVLVGTMLGCIFGYGFAVFVKQHLNFYQHFLSRK